MQTLTPRETDIFNFICDYWKENGYSPSMREICKGCFLASPRSAFLYVDILKTKGYVNYRPHTPRTITITKGAG